MLSREDVHVVKHAEEIYTHTNPLAVHNRPKRRFFPRRSKLGHTATPTIIATLPVNPFKCGTLPYEEINR